jgi:hypothetical protein
VNLDDATSPAPPSVAANDISPIRAAHLGRAGLEDGVAIETPAQPTLGSTCDTLWSRGASVPLPIASALVMSMIALCDESSDEARALTLDDFVPLADGSIEHHETSSAPKVPEDEVTARTLFDLALVSWELFVGKRITPSDVDERGEMASLVTARAGYGPPLGSLERRALAEIDPVLARAFGARGEPFADLTDFAKALDAAARPASRLRVTEWLRLARGPVLRAPLVTPAPPRVAPQSESTRTRAAAPFCATDESALALLALVRDGAKRDKRELGARKLASLPTARTEPASHPATPWLVGLAAILALVASMFALLR